MAYRGAKVLARLAAARFFRILVLKHPVPEFIDPVFAKTSQKGSFSMSENKRFGLFRENWVFKFGHWGDISLIKIKIDVDTGRDPPDNCLFSVDCHLSII